MLTIDKIEGNSGIGVPVFSKFAQMHNYNFIVLSPSKPMKEKPDNTDELLMIKNQEKFTLHQPKRAKVQNESVVMPGAPTDGGVTMQVIVSYGQYKLCSPISIRRSSASRARVCRETCPRRTGSKRRPKRKAIESVTTHSRF